MLEITTFVYMYFLLVSIGLTVTVTQLLISNEFLNIKTYEVFYVLFTPAIFFYHCEIVNN